MKRVCAGIAVSLLSPLAMAAEPAQEEEFPDRFAFNIGAYYAPDIDTNFSLRGGGGAIGTSINFDSDLDGDSSATVPRLFGYYRFNPHHRIDFSWHRVEREGDRVIGRDITFGDTTFPLSTRVRSSITNEVSKLAYTWSFYHTDDVELGATIGAHFTTYELELETSGRELREERSVTGPLPVFGFRLDYTIDPRWHVKFDVETFSIEIGDQYSGSLDDIQLALEYQPFRHVLFGAALNRLAVHADVDDDDFQGSVNDIYRGGQLYVGFRY